jgi:threonine synthase
MIFYSTNNKDLQLDIKDAVIKGLASDNGLFMPEYIPQLEKSFIDKLGSLKFTEIAFEVLKPYFTPVVPEKKLKEIIDDAFNFDIPLKNIEGSINVLELFHGPTSAFKDVGARFLARVLSWFVKDMDQDVHVLAATSGDTGGAVANGFVDVPGIKVVVLYPSGKVSDRQERQFTTLGRNITALEVNGTFDDCQRLVKTAFLDKELNEKLFLTSANSINIARLLPQVVYYFHAYAQLDDKSKDVVISVPSGNFGNLTAGLIAFKMGLPVKRFIAATNINDVVPEYLNTGEYNPRTSVQTLANAMDVGDPSNFVRVLELFNKQLNEIKSSIKGFVVDDDTIRKTVKEVHDKTGYVLDPHGACSYEALKNDLSNDEQGIFLATAHPAKFPDVIEEQINKEIEMPETMQQFMNRDKIKTEISSSFDDFKHFLLNIS